MRIARLVDEEKEVNVEAMVGGDALRSVLERRHAETGASVFEPADSLGE